jgi:hypothetical protein
MFMKTFEEKWTAWIDDQLTGEELTEFEISLPDRAAAEAEKRDALKLRTFLKQQLAVAPAMGNEEFVGRRRVWPSLAKVWQTRRLRLSDFCRSIAMGAQPHCNERVSGCGAP